MHDRIIEIKHDAAKLVFRLEKQHDKNVSFPFSHDHFPICQLIHLHKEPHSKQINDYVHLLAEVPRYIPPGQQINKCVNVDGSTWVCNRPDIT